MEITLFDGHGRPVAYIANDSENSIYLWSGHAVAYINNENLYGWNGRHLGWFVGGILYNLHGQRVGSIREKCPYVTYVESVKYVKYVKCVKCVKHVPYTRPAFSTGYSDEELENFLKQGKA